MYQHWKPLCVLQIAVQPMYASLDSTYSMVFAYPLNLRCLKLQYHVEQRISWPIVPDLVSIIYKKCRYSTKTAFLLHTSLQSVLKWAWFAHPCIATAGPGPAFNIFTTSFQNFLTSLTCFSRWCASYLDSQWRRRRWIDHHSVVWWSAERIDPVPNTKSKQLLALTSWINTHEYYCPSSNRRWMSADGDHSWRY